MTQIFIAGTLPEKKWLEDHVNLVIGVSPVSYLKHSESTLLTLLSVTRVADVIFAAFPYGFLNTPDAVNSFIQLMCTLTFGVICEFSVDLVCGNSPYDTK